MLAIPILLGLLTFPSDTTAHSATPRAPVHSGRLGQVNVQPPRLEGLVTMDGVLNEPMWSEAAVLTGFSQYAPIDGVAATDSTEVLIWYSSKALHIGIRAFDSTGTVRANLANRDQIFSDDNVQIFLSTFNDGRQATFFAVNPLGIQGDGALNERGSVSCNGFNCATQTREAPDLSQDFVWESKGHLTPQGYEVEIRIPFKSIRFQQAKTQTWGINVLRVVQRAGQEQTWTMAKRAGSSFLSQSGHLVGLTDLSAGRALDIVPTMTSRVTGTSSPDNGQWDYKGGGPAFGGNVRYGITPNLTLNATAHPDFSQVEGDVAQFAFDPRQALSFPERRPFFLDGVEQFDSPLGLIYTRDIVQPIFASKLTGKMSGTQVGFLAAVDDKVASRHDENPLFGILRVSRDLGGGGRLGGTWTEQHDGDDENRVFSLDTRVLLNKVHAFSFAGAMTHDVRGGVTRNAPIWAASYRYNGRNFRSSWSTSGIHEDARTRSGFISRPGIASAVASNSYAWLWPKHTLESFSVESRLDVNWKYHDMIHGGPVGDRKMHFNFNARFKGGWNAGWSLLDENFAYDPAIYSSYRLLNSDGTLLPWTTTRRLPNRDYVVQGNTPVWRGIQVSGFLLWGRDENFYEWAPGDIIFANFGASIRPTDQLRVNLSYNQQSVNRPTDGSRVSMQIIPRARIEYQLSRAIQFRLVSQYALNITDSLRDDSRTGLPIVYLNGDGSYTRASRVRSGNLRNDILLSYFPNPGTVLYLGYGASHHEPDDLGQINFARVQDGFFLKLSYLFRIQS